MGRFSRQNLLKILSRMSDEIFMNSIVQMKEHLLNAISHRIHTDIYIEKEIIKRIFRLSSNHQLTLDVAMKISIFQHNRELLEYCYRQLLIKFNISTLYMVSIDSNNQQHQQHQQDRDDFTIQIINNSYIVDRGEHLKQRLSELFKEPCGQKLLLYLLSEQV